MFERKAIGGGGVCSGCGGRKYSSEYPVCAGCKGEIAATLAEQETEFEMSTGFCGKCGRDLEKHHPDPHSSCDARPPSDVHRYHIVRMIPGVRELEETVATVTTNRGARLAFEKAKRKAPLSVHKLVVERRVLV